MFTDLKQEKQLKDKIYQLFWSTYKVQLIEKYMGASNSGTGDFALNKLLIIFTLQLNKWPKIKAGFFSLCIRITLKI